jgi:hypothetical protein
MMRKDDDDDNIIIMKLDSIIMKLGINNSNDDHSQSYSIILKKLDIINDYIDKMDNKTTNNTITNDNNDDNITMTTTTATTTTNNNNNTNDNDDPLKYEWQLYTEEHITPDDGLRSPVCTHILDSWTTDDSKKLYLLDWSNKLKLPLPASFPQGIQFTSLSSVIKDGFLMLLIPSIRKTSIHQLQVFVKQSRKKMNSSNNNNSNNNNDPFVNIDGLIYDIRVKVIGLSNENDTIINDSRSVSVDNTNPNTSSNPMSISDIFPSLVSKTSSLFSGIFNKPTTSVETDTKVDIDSITNDTSIIAIDEKQSDITDSNNNNTSRSSSTDLNNLSPAERVQQRLAELRSKK